ncbi:helix-turn-helix domain-containing protein [Pedobacter sp. N23S346]|uniref:helix-turn-helix domain-containing protein n=1 Tax=Pedobacter sp. N23S346 TaxID=3402750 RepID=UPI003ACBB444
MKKLRDQIGLTQTDMAKLIGSNKTTGSLYEKGLRELNPKALTMLSTIERLMENMDEIQLTEKISLNDQKALVAMLKKLTYDQKLAEQKYEMLQEKLLRMEEAYASNRKLWRLLNKLKKKLLGKAVNPYVGVLEIRCLDKLKACGLHQQVLLRHQLSILESEITSAQQIIKEYEGVGVPVMK